MADNTNPPARRTGTETVVAGTGAAEADQNFLQAIDYYHGASPQVAAGRTEVPRTPAEVTTTVAAARPNDGRIERTSAADAGPRTAVDQAFEYSKTGLAAAIELRSLLAQKLPDTDVVNDGTGPKTVKALREELQKITRDNMEAAIKTARIDDPQADAQAAARMDAFTREPNKDALRQSLCREFGIDPKQASIQKIEEMQQAATGETKDHLRQLAGLEKEYQKLQADALAPSVVRIQYADILASGLLNPDPAGALRGDVPINDVNSAYNLVAQAGSHDRSGELRNSDDFRALASLVRTQMADAQLVVPGQNTVARHDATTPQPDATAVRQQGPTVRPQGTDAATVRPQGTDATTVRPGADATTSGGGPAAANPDAPKMKTMLDALNEAGNLEKAGKPGDAEKAYIAALAVADDLAKTKLPLYLKDLDNQKDSTIQQQWLGTIIGVETARQQYASFLETQGRNAEALTLLTQIRGETPTLVQNNQTFNQLMNIALNGGKQGGDDPNVHLINVQKGIDSKNYDQAFAEVNAAKNALGSMNIDEIKKNVTALQTQKDERQKELDQLKQNQTMNQAEKEARQELLTNQLATTTALLNLEQNKVTMKDQLVYLEGYVDYLRNQPAAAHAKLLEFQNTDLYRSMSGAQRTAYNVDPLLDATKEKSWLQRNLGWVAPVIAGVVAAGAFAATIWSGPGSIAAASATYLAVAGGIGLVAGTSAYVGTTAIAGEKITGRTVVDGLKYSALGISMVAAPGLAAKYGLEIGAPLALGRFAAPAANFTNLAIRGAIVSVPHALIQGTEDVVIDGKPIGSTALSTVESAALGSLGGPKWAAGTAMIGPLIQGGAQNYHDIHDWIHGPLDPHGDQVQISQRNFVIPVRVNAPDASQLRTNQDQDPPTDVPNP